MASVPENLVESELLGHAAGTFGGAKTERIGRFEAAEGGTLFIDEIGDFPQSSQAKLLRVLETRVVHRLGSDVERSVDVRLVAATSHNLSTMMQQGKFRPDLYYRLNVVMIEVPPLRNRRDDIPLLTDHYTRTIARTLGKPVPKLSADLIAYLCDYDWLGNVRELKNCLESMLVLSRGERLGLEDLPAGFSAPSLEAARTPLDDESRLDSLEKSVILQTLRRFDGNRTRTAIELGISVRTLQRRLKSWDMSLFGY
jgi:DNA-binding NtrC family response regulator